jgi:predicted alpha/beta-fold hydrolase
LQTLAGHLLPSAAPPLSRAPRFEVELADGDRLALHALAGTSDTRVVLVHGLSGDVDSDYMRRSALVAQRLGHHVWAVNLRNAGSGRGLACRPYHSGCVADLRAVLEHSHAQDPHLRRVLVGFSLSGNLALLLAAGVTPQPSLPPITQLTWQLGRWPTHPVRGAPGTRLAPLPAAQPSPASSGAPWSPFRPASAWTPAPVPCEAVLAIHPPVDLASAADRTHRGFNRLYELRFVARLRRDIALLARSGLHPTAPIGPFTSLRDLDDRFTAPVSGFASAAEYYERCSSLPHLARIRVPTVILTSLDDPLVDAAPLLSAPLSPCTQLHAERHGGHMGYLSRRSPLRWLDTSLAHLLAEL